MKNGKKLSQLSLMDEKSYSGRIVTHYGNQLEVEVLNGPQKVPLKDVIKEAV